MRILLSNKAENNVISTSNHCKTLRLNITIKCNDMIKRFAVKFDFYHIKRKNIFTIYVYVLMQ